MKDHVFSPCRRWRYTLWREWQAELPMFGPNEGVKYVQFIGLNPSTADEVQNDYWLKKVAEGASLVVAAWGTHGHLMGRQQAVRNLLAGVKPLHHLGLNSDGTPKHPLYLRADTQPMLWEG